MKVFAPLGFHPKHCPFKNVARSDTGSCMAEAMRLVDGRSTFHTLIAAYTLQRAPLTATLAAQHVCEAQLARRRLPDVSSDHPNSGTGRVGKLPTSMYPNWGTSRPSKAPYVPMWGVWAFAHCQPPPKW